MVEPSHPPHAANSKKSGSKSKKVSSSMVAEPGTSKSQVNNNSAAKSNIKSAEKTITPKSRSVSKSPSVTKSPGKSTRTPTSPLPNPGVSPHK